MGANKNTVVLLKVAEALIKAPQKDLDQAAKSVSYTHLTLPTSDLV